MQAGVYSAVTHYLKAVNALGSDEAKAVVAKMRYESSEVPESTTKLIVGHACASMTYGRYSKEQRVQLREAINKLHYAANVMRLIRTPTSEDKAPTTTEKKRVERAPGGTD